MSNKEAICHVRNKEHKLIATIVFVRDLSGVVKVGFSCCSKKDKFSRKVGVELARKRAIEDILKPKIPSYYLDDIMEKHNRVYESLRIHGWEIDIERKYPYVGNHNDEKKWLVLFISPKCGYSLSEKWGNLIGSYRENWSEERFKPIFNVKIPEIL